ALRFRASSAQAAKQCANAMTANALAANAMTEEAAMSAARRVTSESPIAPALSRTEANTLVSAAGMAPSVLNTQPWAFDVHDSTIDVYADPSRGLYWSVDPRGRQLVISCGAALLNLRVAAAHLGRPAAVQLRPLPADPLLLASVTLGRRGERDRTNPADALLFA